MSSQTNLAKSAHCRSIHQMAAQVQASNNVLSVLAFARGSFMSTSKEWCKKWTPVQSNLHKLLLNNGFIFCGR